MAQLPPLHTGAAEPQAFPQAPQFVGSSWVSAQRAVDPLPHVWKGWAQAPVQTPPLHTGVDPPQAVPHVPQFCGSLAKFTQAAPQAEVPLPQFSATHLPAAQTWPLAQAVPQAPQFDGSICRSAQAAEDPLPQTV